jgi:aldehyde:ferredoxin oxidoreductase
MEKILRLDLTSGAIREAPVPAGWQRLGGRGLVARFLLDEVPPMCEPLGPSNKLIFAPGSLVGHMVSSLDRISVGGKSPMTGGVKEANAGGSTGLHMVWLGYKAIIVEGKAPAGAEPVVLYVGEHGARLDPAGDLAGLGTHDTAERIRARYGKKLSAAVIGPGGEARLLAAGVVHLDKDGYPGRISARGGLGAVMGSKGLKAIVVDPGSRRRPPLAEPDTHKAGYKRYLSGLQTHPTTSQMYPAYGTAAMVTVCDAYGALPTRNFSAGSFEDAALINGDVFHDLIVARGGEGNTSHACMAGCIIRCSNVFPDENGQRLVSPVEYETIGLVGSNLGINSPDAIARLNAAIDDLGLDTIDVGAALGVAAEAGLMQWGDEARALELLDEVRRNTPLGRIVGNGAALAGRVLGVERVPVVKGQALSAYDPRAIKGTGVTYATSPQGGDHTAGLTIKEKIEHTRPEGQAALSRKVQIIRAGYDTLGICLFGAPAMDTTIIRDLVNGQHGWGVDEDFLFQCGRETLKLEREFNRLAGFTAKDDRLPEWMTREKLPPTNAVFDVPEAELDALFDW